MMTIGKAGILWKLDRGTGKFIDSRETVYQNVMASQNPVTGEPTLSQDHPGSEGRSVAVVLPRSGRRP